MQKEMLTNRLQYLDHSSANPHHPGTRHLIFPFGTHHCCLELLSSQDCWQLVPVPCVINKLTSEIYLCCASADSFLPLCSTMIGGQNSGLAFCLVKTSVFVAISGKTSRLKLAGNILCWLKSQQLLSAHFHWQRCWLLNSISLCATGTIFLIVVSNKSC